ncbi:MAG: 3-hydroxyacyl-CoA dehydrogenase family protein [Actinomycetaceae bacterium]
MTEIRTAAVVGSGYMGGGIAQCLALAGVDVALADVSAEVATANYERLVAEAEAFEEQGLFPAGATATIRERLTPATSIEEAVAGAEYIQEAVPEDLTIKRDILARVEAAGARGIIATNTSALPIKDIADGLTDPSRFLGVHWMNPAPFVPGAEIIPHATTTQEAIDASSALLARAGKTPAVVSDTPGFVANRLQFALYKEAVRLVEEGVATPSAIDDVVSTTFGFRLALFGPFAIGDMAGLDIYKASYDSLEAGYGERLAAPRSLAEHVADGELGLKSGSGFLDIPAERTAELIAYRNRAYQRLSALRAELGPAPLGE